MKYKATQKDRYGNMKSLEITVDNQLEVPPMASAVPMYDHPGEPRGTDTVPAWLTPGEFVVNKEATDLFGPQIKEMNDIGREIQNGEIPMYAMSGKKVQSMLDQIMSSEKAKGGGDQFTHYKGDKPTKYGITLETYREHINPKATIEDLKKLTEKGAKDIFKKYYYEKYKIDQLPDYMQHNVLDMAINAGPGNAIKLLQKEINSTLPEGKKIAVDNFLGPQTLKAAKNYANKNEFDNSYGVARLNYYNDVAQNNPEKSKFLEGWQNRTNKFIEPREISLPVPKPSRDAEGNVISPNLEVEKPTDIPKPNEDSGGFSLFDIFKRSNSDDNVPTIADMNEQATENPYKSSFVVAKNRGGKIPRYLAPGDEVDEEDNMYSANQLDEVYPGVGKLFHPDPAINKALQEATATVARDKTDEEDLGSIVSGVPREGEGILSYDPQGIGAGVPDKEFNQMETQGQDLEAMTTGYEGAYAPLLTANFMGMGEKDYRKVGGEWRRVKKDGTLASSPASPIQQMNLDTMLNQPPPPSEKEVKAMAQSAMGDAGIGSKVITPAAEVFMGMGTDDGTIMNNMEEVSNKKKANLDTSMDTLMGALDGGDEFLISSAAKAVENATENLGASNISGATQNTNDKSWKHKYAVDEHKEIKKKVENLENLKNNALENGNTALAAVYDQGIDAAQAELDASQEKVDSTASALTNAETNEKEVIENNISPEAAAVVNEATGSNIVPGGSDNNKIIAAANKITDKTESDISAALSSKTGQSALTNNTEDKEPGKWDKAKGVLGFLFGDVFDKRELGRAIAVYLGSRAMGYSHADTIGYVAKNYLKRVDSKNAKMDAFIKANIGKYEKDSLELYRQTGDPSVLIPVGAIARPQGDDPKMYYSKEFPKGRLAYKFKKKLPSGDDIVYWSYDQAGKSRVGAGHHTDAKRVPGTIEYRKRVQDNAKIVEGILEGQIKQSGDRHKEQRVNGVLQWERYTNLDPATAAQDIAAWAEENNYDMTRMGSGIQTAFAMMVADAKETGKKPTNLIPYLEEATIKERLLDQAAELTQAKVGDKIVSMDPKVLTDLNKQVMAVSESLGMHQDTFWNNAVKLWTDRENDNFKSTGKTWREVYQEEAKKPENEGYTPLALFTMRILTLKQ